MGMAVYAGSFDPPTNGHVWVVKKGLEIFNKIIWAVAENPRKREVCDFTEKERIWMLEEIVKDLDLHDVEVDYMGKKLLVYFAQEKNVQYLLRGMRNIEDFEYEIDMRDQNHKLNPEIIPLYLIPPIQLRGLHSKMVKDYVGFERWEEIIKEFVPRPVFEKMLEKYAHLRTKKNPDL